MTALQKAKKKALTLIQYSDRTETEIKERLLQEGYDQEIIDATVIYLKESGFINDVRYAESLIRRSGSTKSRFQIKIKLIKKGVSTEDIEEAFEHMDEEHDYLEQDPEEEAIHKLLMKGIRKVSVVTPDAKRKLFASICRKGFPFNKVKKVWELILQEEPQRFDDYAEDSMYESFDKDIVVDE